MPKQITASMLPAKCIMAISGTVAYSRVAKLIEGEALDADIKRRTAAGRPAITKPYTEITLNNVTVPCADPDHPTVAEQYLAERTYMSNSVRTPGLSFTATSKSPYLPWIGVRNGNQVVQITPDDELATGLRVTAVLQQFQPKNPAMQAGVSLVGIICEEEPRYRQASNFTDLSSLGLTFQPLPSDPMADAAVAAPAQAPVQPQAAMQAQAPAQAPVQAQTPNPFAAAQGQQAPAPNPFAAQAPAQSAPAQNPFPPAAANPFAAAGPNYGQAGGTQTGGIRFNPNEDGGDF